jgi:cytochrome bd ubiquinol oxidase subunit II
VKEVVAVELWLGVTLYAVLGGADFGGGVWDLVAGGDRRGERPRALIDRAITPVWEANHVWLVFVLVVLWTGFPAAFAAIGSTLFVPLALAALGIVLRGSSFAFRHVAGPLAVRRALGAGFALSSVLTPFFMGTVVGAIASGRVPADGSGDRLTSWCNGTSLFVGVLFVATCAYVAATFLVADARRARDAELERYFTRRAMAAAIVTGGLAAAGIAVLHGDARYIYDGLTSDALALVLVSGACGVCAFVALVRGSPLWARPLAVGAVVAVVWGWGVAQHPYLLPTSLKIGAAAAPHATLVALVVVLGVAVIVVGPALALLFTLHQRNVLDEHAPPPGGRTTAG